MCLQLVAPVSPEFYSEDDVPPTPQTEEEEDPSSTEEEAPSSEEEEAPWTPPRPVKRRLFVPETPIHQQGSKRGRFEESEEDSESEESEEEQEILVHGQADLSTPIQELGRHLYPDVANLVFDYFFNFEDVFFMSEEDIRRL